MGGSGGVSMEVPMIGDDTTLFSWPPRLPQRLRRRLLLVECQKTPSTVEDIEAKLRLANLRRQQFYESLASKARPKQRSPSHSSSSEEDPGQRLEAKLQAAEQKRLSILAKAQMRLAKMDELRQVAKMGVESRFEKERKELVTKVELRVQQAEVNRMLILRARRQRRATLKERSSQSIVRRMARESKYKEKVRATIQQKRVAAENKRLELLEAEKKRARARMLRVFRVAKSVSAQREIERRIMRERLEDRLQRAKRQRAEYLRQKGKLCNSIQVNWNFKQADALSRKLARCWRQFLKQRRTTLTLARAYDTMEINEKNVKSIPFEQLANLIGSTTTLETVKALLDRLESRLRVSKAVAATNNVPKVENIDHLLKRVATPKRRTTSRTPMRKREEKIVGSSKEVAKNQQAKSPPKTSRYPVRVVLCAYMILGHPDAVFSGQGEREIALAKSAEDFVREFELLTKVILDGPIQSSDEEYEDTVPKRWTFRFQLSAFDNAWCSYLSCFVAWKVKDAQLLVEDMVRAACQLELSMIQTCKMTPEGESTPLTHDMKAIQKQVAEDQKLLREKVQHLNGDAGAERMDRAIAGTRSKFFEAQENGSPSESPVKPVLSSSSSSSSASSSLTIPNTKDNLAEGTERPSSVARALFKDDSSPPRSSSASSSASSVEISVTENELIVNELLHEQHAFEEGLSAPDEGQRTLKAKIREIMENAFWNDIMDSLKRDDPNFDRIVELMKEVRDEICKIAPRAWEHEIVEAIDLDIFAQVLKSGSMDISYLGKTLEFALVTLQKLTSPANDDEMKTGHQKLLEELADICETRDGSNNAHVIAMVKGLRFVLEQIQTLKQEISKARINLMKPLLKGPAGVDYLRTAFAERYGPPSDAYTSLPLTVQWISSLQGCKDQDWEEHVRFCSALTAHEGLHHGRLPSTALRTGGSFVVNSSRSQTTSGATKSDTGDQLPECNGGTVDLLVRLGLLKLVSGVSGLTKEVLPETFVLNLARLRDVQAEIQKIVVISTSILIFRQTLMSEQVVTTAADMETIVSKCTEQLIELLDNNENAGIEEITETISRLSEDNDKEKIRLRKEVTARMLGKSLQSGDPVFEKVSRAVHLAARGVMLGGNGPRGQELAVMALRKVGASALTQRVVKAVNILLMAASVSVSVHEPWYKQLTDNMQK